MSGFIDRRDLRRVRFARRLVRFDAFGRRTPMFIHYVTGSGSRRNGGTRRCAPVAIGQGRDKDLAEAEQSLLIRPTMGQSQCKAGDRHTRGSGAVGDGLNDFWRQERKDGQPPDMTFGETFIGGDVI